MCVAVYGRVYPPIVISAIVPVLLMFMNDAPTPWLPFVALSVLYPTAVGTLKFKVRKGVVKFKRMISGRNVQ